MDMAAPLGRLMNGVRPLQRCRIPLFGRTPRVQPPGLRARLLTACSEIAKIGERAAGRPVGRAKLLFCQSCPRPGRGVVDGQPPAILAWSRNPTFIICRTAKRREGIDQSGAVCSRRGSSWQLVHPGVVIIEAIVSTGLHTMHVGPQRERGRTPGQHHDERFVEQDVIELGIHRFAFGPIRFR